MDNSFRPQTALAWRFTDKPVTAWGGLRLVQEMLLRMRFREALRASGLPEPGSNRGYDPAVMMEVFLVCVWIGGMRFSHTMLVRFDEALREIFGWNEVASVSTFTRFFRRFKRQDVDRVFGNLNTWFWDQLSPRTLTLDLDSSVVVRHGEQEGAVVGYNLRSPGKPSHHPLFAFVADQRMVLHAWLRPGNTASGNGSVVFLREALGLLGTRHRVGLVRADAGFYDGGFLNHLEAESIPYIIAGMLTVPLRHCITAQKTWTTVAEGIDIAEFGYEALKWGKKRRMIVVRQRADRRPKALGKPLIDVPGYLFHAFVTTLTLPPAEVWRIYNGRSDSENRIAELKHDFGIKGFCLDPFYATEAAFRAVLLGYNLMSLFRQALLQAPKAVRLPTMRFECFALGAWIGREGRNKVVRISVPPRRRAWFSGLFATIQAFSPPWPAPA